MASSHASRAGTDLQVGELIDILIVDAEKAPQWPPDAFGVVASILNRSGAYTCVVDDWPPVFGSSVYKSGDPPDSWAKNVERIGERWRTAAANNQAVPSEVAEQWNIIKSLRHLSIDSVCTSAKERVAGATRPNDSRRLVNALLELCAMADSACYGVGGPGEDDQFWFLATTLVTEAGSLCRDIHPSRLRVLPKLHTPQKGMTLRSLTHHLSLCPTSGIVPSWKSITTSPSDTRLNILLVPWPKEILPRQFVEIKGPIQNIAPGFGFFTFEPLEWSNAEAELFKRIATEAVRIVGRIDGIVFPELSLTDRQFEQVKSGPLQNAFLISGIAEAGASKKSADEPATFGKNRYRMHFPSATGSTPVEQSKHHRWKIERSQILQYGLGGSLRSDWSWWEYCSLEERHLVFVALTPWLSFCVMICEDLARQDPIAELVRSVGPNLVIALLMDGPQLKARWSARYATVLADDPGCSVLTLTSLGMAELCRPMSHKTGSRVIALWHDARTGGPHEIELDRNAEAVILSLSVEQVEEWSADGRTDNGQTGYPILTGVHQVRCLT